MTYLRVRQSGHPWFVLVSYSTHYMMCHRFVTQLLVGHANAEDLAELKGERGSITESMRYVILSITNGSSTHLAGAIAR